MWADGVLNGAERPPMSATCCPVGAQETGESDGRCGGWTSGRGAILYLACLQPSTGQVLEDMKVFSRLSGREALALGWRSRNLNTGSRERGRYEYERVGSAVSFGLSAIEAVLTNSM